MQLNAFRKRSGPGLVTTTKVFTMKLVTIFLLALSLHSSAENIAQEITLSLSNVSLETVFKEIEKQKE